MAFSCRQSQGVLGKDTVPVLPKPPARAVSAITKKLSSKRRGPGGKGL